MNRLDAESSAALDAARERICAAAAQAVTDAGDVLLANMRDAPTPQDRGQATSAQEYLLKHQETLLAAFRAALRDKVREDIGEMGPEPGSRDPTDWEAIGLVETNQIEERLSFERIGQFIGHECEAELRELSGYTSAMLGHAWTEPERNPLRGNVIGSALQVAIEKFAADPADQKLFAKELGQAMAKALPAAYRAILSDLGRRGFHKAELAVRTAAMPLSAAAGATAAMPTAEQMRELWERSMVSRTGFDPGQTISRWETSLNGRPDALDPPSTGYGPHSTAGLLDRLMRSGLPGSASSRMPLLRNPAPPQADANLMMLLRRLNDFATGEPAPAFAAASAAPDADGLQAPVTENVIRAHREQLMQASQGKLDHLLIDVVSSLFDQILADTRVPPQMARQIARLQLPVLRVALRDPSFFSSRTHPVRRFINRVSALGAGVDDFDDGAGRQFLERVGNLVKDIIEGDFDQIELYHEKLRELEAFTAEQAKAEAGPACETLQAKEREWRRQHRFSQRMVKSLEPLPLPPFLKEFLSQVWGQVIVIASQRDGGESGLVERYRRAAFELAVSIQPQRSTAQRKHFLATLPGLMATLNEGMVLIDWPAPAREEFLGQLMSAHAGSLKAARASDLDHNLLLRQLEVASKTPLPTGDEPDDEPLPESEKPIVEPRFSPEEARSVGLIGEAAVDWTRQIEPVAGTAHADADGSAEVTTPMPLESGAPALAAIDMAAASPIPATAEPVAAEPVPTTAGPAAAALAFPALDRQAAVPAPSKTEPAPPQAAIAPADPLLPAPAADAEPTEGPRLREHLRIGISYQLHLRDRWEKVRLTYMSPARTFFLFSHGSKDRGAISMTSRMLERLCETRRMRAFEAETLIDRATARARRQLAAATPSRAHAMH